ncbi:MAG: CNNM domain-containing protein, partial [Nanoarchaeota archaeon]
MLTDMFILLILVALSAFFSCAETAFMTISRLKAETLAKQKIKGAQTLLKLKEQPRQFIITILIGNNIVNTGASALATVLATDMYGSTGIGIATGIMTFILLTFGEIIPKSLATTHAEDIILFIAQPSMVAIKVMYPLVLMFEWVTTIFIKMFGGAKATQLYSESELKTLVEIG